MAKIKLKSYIKSVHGRLGNVVYYNVKGYQYARSYSIPLNPRTEAQQKNRSSFADAVHAWQNSADEIKASYNELAEGKPLSGYNLFISMHMKGEVYEKGITGEIHGADSLLSASPLLLTNSVIHSPSLALHQSCNLNIIYRCMKPPGDAPRAA